MQNHDILKETNYNIFYKYYQRLLIKTKRNKMFNNNKLTNSQRYIHKINKKILINKELNIELNDKNILKTTINNISNTNKNVKNDVKIKE